MTTAPAPAPLFVRISEAKQFFGVHKNTLYRWAADGAFPIYKRGEVSLVSVAEVSAFITGQGRAAA